jgi:hypothetical protein
MKDNSKAWADELEVDEFPSCIFCGKEAQFNAKTQADLWCYLCEGCFMEYGRGLDPTDGQILVLKPKGGENADL